MLVDNVLRLGQPIEEICLTSSQDRDARWSAESSLVEACQNGDLQAFEQIYRDYGVRMKSVACNLLGNVHDAEDAVQEAFLKIYRGIRKFRGGSSLSTWIFRILVNTCYDLRRKRQRQVENADANSEIVLHAPAGSVPDHPLRLTLEKHLGRLEPRSRTVFCLYEVEGFKHAEIAEILEIPEGTSKNILFQAKRELRRLIWP